MSTAKGEGLTARPGSAAQVRTRRGSTTILTQDPNVPSGTIVPNDVPYSLNTPGTVKIAGPLVLPGLSFTLHCGTLETVRDSRQQPGAINVNGLPGAPPPDRLEPASSGAKGEDGIGLEGMEVGKNGKPGTDGLTGQDGLPGRDAGNIDITVTMVTPGTNLLVSADGGQGGKGQAGQTGGSGGAGGRGAARHPMDQGGGGRLHGVGGKGGNGGNGGNGGPGGHGGVIIVTCSEGSIGSFEASVKGGPSGDGGAPGGYGAGGTAAVPGPDGAAGQPGNAGSPGPDGTINPPQ